MSVSVLNSFELFSLSACRRGISASKKAMSSSSRAMAPLAHKIWETATFAVLVAWKVSLSFSFVTSVHHWFRSMSSFPSFRMLVMSSLIMPITLSKGPAVAAPLAAPCCNAESTASSPAPFAEPTSSPPPAAVKASLAWSATPAAAERASRTACARFAVAPSWTKLGPATAKSRRSRSRNIERSIFSSNTAAIFTAEISFPLMVICDAVWFELK
mmetsp:Transcript_114831/g.329782  ORF Transcript_114831/g.329782 Transcript_114831/m.329782 type:complete len:214 (-) Transcript_114831:654-1295(-)